MNAEVRRDVCDDSQPGWVCSQLHDQKVQRIATQLRARTSTRPLAVHKKSVSHELPKAGALKYSDEQLDISDLTAIIRIDAAARICVAESGVTFVDLVTATLRHGLVPIIVPELKTITIGGAVAGCSIESMSFKHGGFHDTCTEYEVITAKGEILICTPENENRLLFQMMHGTFGTLGIISRLTFKLIPAKPFVMLTYEKYSRLEDYQAAIWRHYREQDVDFMDGIIHSMSELVLSVGRFVDQAPYTNRYDWTKVYYKSTRSRAEDYLRTPDYFFRYDHGVTNVHPRTLLGRLLFGRFMDSSHLLRLAEKFRWLLRSKKPTITLDVFIPFSRVRAFLEWYAAELSFFPLWMVPYRRGHDYEWLSAELWKGMQAQDELFLDLAIYGMKQRGDKNYHKLIEDKLIELGGIKTLISYNYYSEQDFWKIWNRENYDKVKRMTDPDNIFRDLYTKTCVRRHRAARLATKLGQP